METAEQVCLRTSTLDITNSGKLGGVTESTTCYSTCVCVCVGGGGVGGVGGGHACKCVCKCTCKYECKCAHFLSEM